MTGSDRRRVVLDEIERLVCGDRQKAYGDAENNFAHIAAIINVVLSKKLAEPLDALDVALISCSIKLARLQASRTHEDSWLDLAGYAVCGAGVLKSREGQ